MRRNLLSKTLLLGLVALTLACKTKKVIIPTPVTPAETPVVPTVDKRAEYIKLLRSKNVNFNTLSMKGKANIDFNGNTNNVSMNVKMERDKKIWVSITAVLGIEVARAVITPDSIFVLNKLQSTYLKKPIRYIYNYTSKEVSFKLLQDVLTGNAISSFFNPNAQLDVKNDLYELNGTQGNLGFTILFNTLLKPRETNLNDLMAGQALKVVYGDYQKVNEYVFPTAIKINSMSGKRKVAIDLDFSKVEMNVPVDFPYSVPKRFELIN
ncbi:MAG: DUF4292 domain-containing protein [Pedobacter sp.]|nr:MAG: DUF4292 domain-containing protein [Pedobacter sp.]